MANCQKLGRNTTVAAALHQPVADALGENCEGPSCDLSQDIGLDGSFLSHSVAVLMVF